MKHKACIKTIIVASLFIPILSIANCGDFPAHPSFLANEYITQDELDSTTESLDKFLLEISEYQQCISNVMSELSPEKTNSQSLASQYALIDELLLKSQDIAVNRHNQLLSNLEFSPLEIK